MTNEYKSGETMGAKALMFAVLAGVALLFVEVTWSPTVQPEPEHAPVARTAVHHERLAQT
ncbi:MAG TPA: hypothetical protein VGB91_01775 [Rhizomicrobium sp.]